jgi:23S rRNA (cytidine1920-2'-O)/16S rRNA (cytidine1409-2'-O)-methyltransferase
MLMSVSEKCRLDILLVERGLAPSREKARAIIMAGKVLVNGVRVEKPGRDASREADLTVEEPIPFVSRGGLKLQGALEGLGISVEGLSILDAGASTGGFTDCLLQRGAGCVVAVDVGYGQFHWKLRNDRRVTLIERRNFRFMDNSELPHPLDAAVADVSFISLKLVLPKFIELLPVGGWLLALVKPQFEVGRGDVGKGGVVRDPTKIRAAVDSVVGFARTIGFEPLGEWESPIKGPKGNQEVFVYLRKIHTAPGESSTP